MATQAHLQAGGGYDVAIVGAGPAGATLARIIGEGCKVLLIDRRPMAADPPSPGQADKCCGGLLAPDGQEMLARQGLGLPRDVLVGPQLFVVRTLDLRTRRERYYQRHYINLDRGKLDRWLLSLVPGGVDVRLGCRFRSFERGDGGFTITLAADGKEYREQARLLVGADGAASRVRRLAFPDTPWPKRYAAIQEWFACPRPPPYFCAIFDRDTTDFYAWTIPKEEGLVVGAALEPVAGAAERFERLKVRLAEFGFRFDRRLRRHGGLLLRPTRVGQICTGGAGIALIGEAAGWISPSSAEGISYAFRSALALADAIEARPGDVLAAYRRNTASLRRNILAKNLKSPFIYNDFLRGLVMRSGIGSMDIRR